MVVSGWQETGKNFDPLVTHLQNSGVWGLTFAETPADWLFCLGKGLSVARGLSVGRDGAWQCELAAAGI